MEELKHLLDPDIQQAWILPLIMGVGAGLNYLSNRSNRNSARDMAREDRQWADEQNRRASADYAAYLEATTGQRREQLSGLNPFARSIHGLGDAPDLSMYPGAFGTPGPAGPGGVQSMPPQRAPAQAGGGDGYNSLLTALLPLLLGAGRGGGSGVIPSTAGVSGQVGMGYSPPRI